MDKTKKRLYTLFDFQLFEGNQKLSDMLREAEFSCGETLREEDLYLISAAGEPQVQNNNRLPTEEPK